MLYGFFYIYNCQRRDFTTPNYASLISCILAPNISVVNNSYLSL